MTPFRKRMIEDLQLSGMSARTQELSGRAVRPLAEHYRKSPDQITEEELRQYFLSLKNVKNYSRSASTLALCGMNFFSEYPLQREWSTLPFVRPPREQKLPVILRTAEVRRLLRCFRRPRSPGCWTTISSCGLRLQEGPHLPRADIDRARMLLHIRHGNGAKDRSGPLPQRPRHLLRPSWATHRHPVWMFPAPGRGGIHTATATHPMPRSSVQDACRAALKQSGLHNRASVPPLRHAWATHLLEAGGKLRLSQAS